MIIRYDDFGKSRSKKKANLMTEARYFQEIDGIQNHIDAMIVEGKSADEINEGLDGILNFLGGGFKKTLYQYAASWILEKLGLPKEGWTMELATQIITEVDFTKITNYFGKGSCGPWAQAIQRGLVNFVTVKAGDYILGSLNIAQSDPARRSGLSNTLIKTITNGAGNALNDTKFLSEIEKSIQGTICGEGAPGFSDIFKGKKADPATKNEVEDALHKASQNDPNVMGQAKGLGILNYLGFGGK